MLIIPNGKRQRRKEPFCDAIVLVKVRRSLRLPYTPTYEAICSKA